MSAHTLCACPILLGRSLGYFLVAVRNASLGTQSKPALWLDGVITTKSSYTRKGTVLPVSVVVCYHNSFQEVTCQKMRVPDMSSTTHPTTFLLSMSSAQPGYGSRSRQQWTTTRLEADSFSKTLGGPKGRCHTRANSTLWWSVRALQISSHTKNRVCLLNPNSLPGAVLCLSPCLTFTLTQQQRGCCRFKRSKPGQAEDARVHSRWTHSGNTTPESPLHSLCGF